MLEHVWQPGAIGPLQLPHRLVMGSMHLGLESVDPDGSMLAAFYAERAAGGAGLIVTGGSAVSRVGAGGVSYSFINEDAEAEKLAAIPAAVHAAGGPRAAPALPRRALRVREVVRAAAGRAVSRLSRRTAGASRGR